MRNFSSFYLLLLVMGLYSYMQPCQAGESAAIEIAPGVYVWSGAQEEFSPANGGHIANIGFIVGDQRVAVIDTGSSYAEGLALRRMISEVTPLPVGYVILTHMHPDHVLGAAAFTQDKPVFIGHQQLNEAMARRQQVYVARMKQILGSAAEGTRMVFPSQNVAIGRVFSLDLGNRTLQLRAYPTAHTNNDLTIFDEQTGTLWLSDLLFVERIPVMDGSLLGWLKLIDNFMQVECMATGDSEPGRQTVTDEDGSQRMCERVARVVPGHGPVVTQWKAALADERHYLETIADGIRKVIKKGGTIPEAVESVGWGEQNKWLLFQQYHGRNVTAGFAELEWE
ncbi:MAG: MBL fold metallo-hydrolase [Candidatus Thiodiazotropha sp.]